MSAELDFLSLALGGMAASAVTVPLLAWRHWRTEVLAARLAEAEETALRLAHALETAPEGYFCWPADGNADPVCSRRLAVLLGLGAGTASVFEDVLEAIHPSDARLLAEAVTALRGDGRRFELELSLAGCDRRVLAQGMRAATLDGEPLADLVWMQDVTEGAAAVDFLSGRLEGVAEEAGRTTALLDGLPMPVWLRDDDLSLVYVNHAYALAVEAPDTDQVIARQIELASDDVVREARAVAARARASGEARAETFHLVLGGNRKLVLLTEAPLVMDGKLLTAGFIADQTQIEELEAEITRHVAAHAEVLEYLATAIAIFAPDTRLAFFNTAFTRLWRIEPDWLEAQPTYGAVLDALRERRLLPEVADYRAYKEEELKRFLSLIDPVENLMHLPDGRTLRRVIAAHPHGGLIFTYEDVTDTLALERSFNTMLAVQRETLDHLHEGVAVFGGDGRLKLYNPAYARIWDMEPETLAAFPHVGELVERHRRFFDARPGRASDWPATRERLLGLFAERTPSQGRLERQDGTILDYATVPLPDGALLLTWLDVSDTARVERALRERNEALAAADTLKSEFIANVSCEVRKPLTTIIGFSEMLGEQYFGALNDRQEEYCKGITLAGRHLLALISDILDLAAIEAGQMTLELDTVDIHPLLSSVLELVRERVREKKLSLGFDCPLDIGWIVADERRLRQVMFNLVGNAVKFTPPGGRVDVRARQDGSELCLTVADSGPGMVDGTLTKAFDSFARGEDGGAGLGLTLVRRFVELHGGRVDIKSAPGQGTTVSVRLPAAPADNDRHGGSLAPAGSLG